MGHTDWDAIALLYEGVLRLAPTIGAHEARPARGGRARLRSRHRIERGPGRPRIPRAPCAMMFPILLGPAFLYVVVASWAVRSGGVRRLWAVASGAVVGLVLIGTGVGLWYAVPSLPLLLLYLGLLFGPMVLVTALALTAGGTRTASFGHALAVAALGAMLGLTIGFFVAVYGLHFARR